MSVQVENVEKNMVKLTIEVPAEEFENAMRDSYNKQKKDFSIPGFRKGKVPQIMIEKMFGPSVFYEDAANALIPQAYAQAARDCEQVIVSRPKIEVTQAEKGKPFIFTAEAAIQPEVVLGQYTDIPVTWIDTSVTDEEVQKAIDTERENNARLVNVEGRSIETGDTAVIDYEGFADGEPFEGGTGENHSLEIGSGTFIEGFEDQLIGKNAGEEVEVRVTFPEDYHTAELEGKDAVFHVTIHEIKAKEIPELDDEFAQDVSEYDTVEEYRESVRRELEGRKEADARRVQQDEAISKIVAGAQMDIPEPMIETQCEDMVNHYAFQLAQQGIAMDAYLKYIQKDLEGLKEEMRPDVIERLKTELVLRQIVKDEKLEVSDEELDAEIEKMARMYNREADSLKEDMDDDQIEGMRLDLEAKKAVEFIMASVQPCESVQEETADESRPEEAAEESREESADESQPEEAAAESRKVSADEGQTEETAAENPEE